MSFEIIKFVSLLVWFIFVSTKRINIMKTQTLKSTYKNQTLYIYLMVDSEGAMLDMNGWDRQYFNTEKEAQKRAKEMFKTEIDNLKYA